MFPKSGTQNRTRMDALVNEALEIGVNVEYITMKDTGHEFPETYYDTLMMWMNNIIK